jgi:hypothetical protein
MNQGRFGLECGGQRAAKWGRGQTTQGSRAVDAEDGVEALCRWATKKGENNGKTYNQRGKKGRGPSSPKTHTDGGGKLHKEVEFFFT